MIKRSLVSQLLFFIQHIGEAQRIQVPRRRAAKNHLELATLGTQDPEVSVSLPRSLHLPSCSKREGGSAMKLHFFDAVSCRIGQFAFGLSSARRRSGFRKAKSATEIESVSLCV